MRAPNEMPRRRRRRTSNRGRIALVVGIIVLFLLVISLRGVAKFYTDYLWFQNLHLTSVFTGIVGAKIALAAIFTIAFFIPCYVGLTVADRTAPTFRPVGPEDELLSRYHDFVAPRAWMVRAGVSLLFTLIAGVGQSNLWQQWLLFIHAQNFGVKDATFHTDVGFYVFKLPFYQAVIDWMFASLVIILLITLVADYLNGGIRPQSPLQRVTPQVKAHVSVLLGSLALVKAADYWLARYSLTLSGRGYVTGATYADVHASLPALNLLLFIALLSFGLFIYNIWQRGWVLPAVAVGLWALVSIVANTAYPAFIEAVRVKPSESGREAPYIKNNIGATRQAMGLTHVASKNFNLNTNLTIATKSMVENRSTLHNIPLLDRDLVSETYKKLQGYLAYTTFNKLETDRYRMTGSDGKQEETQVLSASRDLNLSQAQQQSWEGQHILYTHGYGLAMAPSAAVTGDGNPAFVVQNVPVQVDKQAIDLQVKQPQVYFSTGQSGYAIVDSSKQPEIDFLNRDGSPVNYTYTGSAGVQLNSIVKRAAFALRFGDWNPIISSYVTDHSRILYVRDIQQRVQAVAPFLTFDGDPYPVVIDGQIKYIVDGYTTTNRYPNAERADTTNVVDGGMAGKDFNYVRNSVKAVVDAYNGTVTLYVVDKTDPIIKAYEAAFPHLFDQGQIPQNLTDHFRYPNDLFTVQTNMWARYHIDDPQAFYNQAGGWSVAQDPGHDVVNPQQTTSFNQQGQQEVSKEARVDPYYAIMKTQGQSHASFQSIRSFVPFSRDDSKKTLAAFMVAGSDLDNYGQLTTYQVPAEEAVEGPALVGSAISANKAVSNTTTPLNQQGSFVKWGNLVLYPVDGSILYVRPLYVGAQGGTRLPQVQDVVVDFNHQIVVKATLQQALEALFPDAPPGTFDDVGAPPPGVANSSSNPNLPGTGSSSTTSSSSTSSTTSTTAPPTTTPGDQSVAQLIALADKTLSDAQAALTSSCAAGSCDFNAYFQAVARAQNYLDQAQAKSSGTAPTTGASVTTAPGST